MTGSGRLVRAWLLAALLSGCSTWTLERPDGVQPEPAPTGTLPSTRPAEPEARGSAPADMPMPAAEPVSPKSPPQPKPAVRPAAPGGDVFLQRLLAGIADRAGWARDYRAAFKALGIKPSAENVCAALAVTEQESSFNADPPVAGLPGIVRGELRQRAERYHVPAWMLDASLALTSPNGRTYGQRIDALRTENDLNRLYDDLISQVPLGKSLLADNSQIQLMLDNTINKPGEKTHNPTTIVFDPKKLLPRGVGSGKFYTYSGSLTTPPCTEGVNWYVYEKPITLSDAQLLQLKSFYEGNDRHLQEPNGRQVVTNK